MLLGTSAARRIGERLYAEAVAQARTPAFYAELRAPDEIDARFELYTLHVLLLVMRLRQDGERGAEIGQALFDAYVGALDDTLRELGVGDVSVPKKMRKLGEQLYGRMSTYEPLLAAEDAEGLAAALARNLYEREGAPEAARLANYALRTRAALAAQSDKSLMGGKPGWAAVLEPVAA